MVRGYKFQEQKNGDDGTLKQFASQNNHSQTKSLDPTKNTVRSTITSVRRFPESSSIQGLLPTSHTSAITLSSSISTGSNDLAPRVEIVTAPDTKPPATCARRKWGNLRSYHDSPDLNIPQ
ncbi:predicted protein [Histoplasma capsulatum var. duboisii H88]|uniref:Predicted protein n=1 Tax=Ajellomyces capsulatus (strain H88) TaxID=544711 RepID=F0UF79_AJEC8|nr:predicted protein [Histoplasma capsulatum var. duboisii H88]